MVYLGSFRSCLVISSVVLSVVSALPQPSSPLGPVVNLGYAAFVGNSTSPTGEANGPVTFFGGIRYAKPPLGDLRFRAPAQLDETVVNSGNITTTDARNWGPPCIQQPAQVGIGDEDCLRINIWKPSDAKEGDKLPVLFYIHGGGFFDRNPESFPLYDLVNQSNPKIVGVNFGYRLNMLGFLAGSAVAEDGDQNAGLLDQQAALEWVTRHIGSFGGDPNQITIDGESAGGASVVMHMVAFGASKPALFNRAIAQSIGYGSIPTVDESEATFKKVTETVGCPDSGSQAMSCLRTASVGAIVAAINEAGGFSPVVDGPNGILPDLPNTLLTQGKFHTVDFIGGHCTNDGTMFVGGTPDDFKTDEDIIERVFGKFTAMTNETIQKALSLYPEPGAPGSPFTSQFDRASTIEQDTIFSCMDWSIANALQQRKVNNVFTFSIDKSLVRFNSPNPVLLAQAPFEGVMHTSDLFYLFSGITSQPNAGFSFTLFNSTEAVLSRDAIGFWSSFASSGNPSTSRVATSPAWKPFFSGERIVLNQPSNASVMGSASVLETTPPEQIERCKFWMALNTTEQTRF